jgi:hypothetical protein
MSDTYDVFISYARADSKRAQLVRRLLEDKGLKVFFDAEGIETGEEFTDVIDRAVKGAKCVLGLWSKPALSSRWVRIESRIGLDQKKLVAAVVDDTRPEDLPAEFYNVNIERLADFQGEPDHEGWLRVLRGISRRIGRADLAAAATASGAVPRPAPVPALMPEPTRAPAATPVPAAPAPARRSRWPWIVGGTLAVLAAAGATVFLSMRPQASRPADTAAPQPARTPAAGPPLTKYVSGWGQDKAAAQADLKVRGATECFVGTGDRGFKQGSAECRAMDEETYKFAFTCDALTTCALPARASPPFSKKISSYGKDEATARSAIDIRGSAECFVETGDRDFVLTEVGCRASNLADASSMFLCDAVTTCAKPARK